MNLDGGDRRRFTANRMHIVKLTICVVAAMLDRVWSPSLAWFQLHCCAYRHGCCGLQCEG